MTRRQIETLIEDCASVRERIAKYGKECRDRAFDLSAGDATQRQQAIKEMESSSTAYKAVEQIARVECDMLERIMKI